MPMDWIHVKNARVHNLKSVEVRIPRGQMTVFTGLSGSGKSSLAFDTIYAEGQRRYVESLSAYARQFLELMEKPDVDAIEGLSPAISIEQKATSHNPRSTVGTVTEILDYLRLLYARIGQAHCPKHDLPLAGQRPEQIADALIAGGERRLILLAPVVDDRKGEYLELMRDLAGRGFVRLRVDGKIYDIEEVPSLALRSRHTIEVVVDRLRPRSKERQRLLESIGTALELAGNRLRVLDDESGEITEHSAKQACPKCGFSMPEMEPKMFSFNNAAGACPKCHGLGVETIFSPERVVANPHLSLAEGAIPGWGKSNPFHFRMLARLGRKLGFSVTRPFAKLPAPIQKSILHGYRSGRGKSFEGVIPNIERRWQDTESSYVRDELAKLIAELPCSACHGKRLRPEACAVKIAGVTLPELTGYSLLECRKFFAGIKLGREQQKIGARILREVRDRLQFLGDVGLGYLSLDRSANTLSGGESQRIRLASQVGSGLTGVTYVLDEPSIGLHAVDNKKLLASLRRLCDLDNTVIVVEHDEEAIRNADNIVDIGPGAGVNGGRVIATGNVGTICKIDESLTGRYLSGKRHIPVPTRRNSAQRGRELVVRNARGNNLRGIDARFPLGLLVCVTGVSGSGKSSLVADTLQRAVARKINGSPTTPLAHDRIDGIDLLDKIIDIDQSPIGRTPRSNPATYTGLLTPVRELFAELPLARERGYKPGHFSFNVAGGRCEACEGDGVRKVEMHFLPDVYVTCETCGGKRYKDEILEVKYRGKSIHDVLDMTVDEAVSVFANIPNARRRLTTLQRVGLGYIKLGQSATTLSGGEAQRIKLSLELSKRATGSTLYLLDEPTTGLHFHDVAMLLKVLLELRESGNTVIVVEHNLEVIKTADWIIDLGPGGGDAGGQVVASGPPEKIVQRAKSLTGRYLRPLLAG